MTDNERKRIYDLLLMDKITIADAIERLTNDEPDRLKNDFDKAIEGTQDATEALEQLANAVGNLNATIISIFTDEFCEMLAATKLSRSIAYNYGQWAAMSGGMGNLFYKDFDLTMVWMAGVWRNRCEN